MQQEKQKHQKKFDFSMFLTPPLSTEATIPNKTISRIGYLKDFGKPLLCFDDDAYETSNIDILLKLHEKSLITTVCCKILEKLSDIELVRASHVSKTWMFIIRYLDIKSGRRVSRFLRKRRNTFTINKENSLLVKKTPIYSEFRRPFSSASENITSIETQEKEQASDTFKTPTPSTSKDVYTHCPACQSPSKIAYKQTGHCANCKHDFCLHCFYTGNQHSPTCQIVGGSGVTGSSRKLGNNNKKRFSIGSKDNKSRLKRL